MMYCEEEQRDIPDEEGFCRAMARCLSDNRHVLLLSLLLIATVTAISKGLYDGITTGEYSNSTLAIGIFFPSISLVLICIYIVIDCTRHASRISTAIHYSTNQKHSQSCEDIAHLPERCPGNRINVKVEHRLSVSGSPVVNPPRISTVEVRRKEFCTPTEKLSVSCKSQRRKVSRRSSDSDVSLYDHLYNEKAVGGFSCKKHEKAEMASRGRSCKKHENCEYSPRCAKHQKTQKSFISLKRFLSDSSCKYENAESKEKIPKCNMKLPTGRKPSLKVHKQQSDNKKCSDTKFEEGIKNIFSKDKFNPNKLNENFKSSKDNATECDCMDGNEMYRHRGKSSCLHIEGYSFQNLKKENVDSPLIKYGTSNLPKTCEEKRARCEYKQQLHLSAQAQYSLSNKSYMDRFLTENTQSQYRQSSSSSKFVEDGKGQKCISSLQSTETRDQVKRKAIYSPHSFNFLKYPGYARQGHPCHPRDEKAMGLSPRKNASMDCYSVSEPKEKEYLSIGNTAQLSRHNKDGEYHSVSDTREKKSPTICYVEKRLSAINKGKSDSYSVKELKKIDSLPFYSASIRLSPKSDDDETVVL